MRTFPNIRLDVFTDPSQREEIKKISDHLRQVSGGLARSIMPGQTPAANPVPSSSGGTPPPPGSTTPTPIEGDLLYGLGSGNWARLPIGSEDSVLISAGGIPSWLGSGSQLGVLMVWNANGPFLVGTKVDAGFISPSNMTITAVWLYRGVQGSSSTTIVDLNKNGASMFSGGARPQIAFSTVDKMGPYIPDVTTSVLTGDILTMDIDQIEGGTPMDLALIVKGSPT